MQRSRVLAFDLPAVVLHEGHQPVVAAVAFGAEKEQVFKEMGQTRPGGGYVVAACGNAHEGGGTLETWLMMQAHVQAVVQHHMFGGRQ